MKSEKGAAGQRGSGAEWGISGAACTKGQRGSDRIGKLPLCCPTFRREGQS
jgi:hypothetical protein